MQLRVALQLMKLAREMLLQDFLRWLHRQEWLISEVFPEGFIELCLLYAVYADTSRDLREDPAPTLVGLCSSPPPVELLRSWQCGSSPQ